MDLLKILEIKTNFRLSLSVCCAPVFVRILLISQLETVLTGFDCFTNWTRPLFVKQKLCATFPKC
jgi:hypothetical protein